MRNIISSTLTVAAILSASMLSVRAEAIATTPVAGIATTGARLHVAGIVCGGNGCVRPQTGAIKHRKFQPLGHG
jgi:hypothetical protein